MPRSEQSLTLAAESHARSREDRLTALYATVLDEHDGFATEVLAHVGLPGADRYEAYTQETRSSGRVDLILKGLSKQGAVEVFLYAEHKEPAGKWQPGQPKKYLHDLSVEEPRTAQRRLVAVVDSGSEASGRVRHRAQGSVSAVERAARLQTRKREPRLAYTTWQAIAGCAELAGRKAFVESDPGLVDPLAWRDAAREPTAPARQRLLLELIWYLEDKGYAVTTPLTKEQVAIYHQAVALDETLAQLMKTATDFLTDDSAPAVARCKLSGHRSSSDGLNEQRFETARNTWLNSWGGQLWLVVDANGGKGRSKGGELCFWAEIWLPAKDRDKQLARRQGFMDELEKRSLRFDPVDEGAVSINTSMPVTPLLKLKTIEEQARVIANWATDAFGQLLSLKPGRPPGS